ncbi:MAG: hypothetical protein L3J45_07355 [Flavobacteriaceae bacterium]|nr:hypothetical protein [Flavobacteriaceae bacterium]
MNDTKFKHSVILFAEVIVPDLRHKKDLNEAFFINFNKIISNLEYNASSKIKLLIEVITLLSLVYNFKSFDKLSYPKRKIFIDGLFQFPIGKIVAGLTGLRSLTLISYYGLEQIWPQINYTNSIR